MTQDNFGLNAETVYFDGQCPLCTREIQFYQRQRGAKNVNWVDVTKVGVLDLPFGLKQEDALARFHIVNANGQLFQVAKLFLPFGYPCQRFVGREDFSRLIFSPIF